MPRAHLRRRFSLPAFAATGVTALAACGGHGASTASAKTASTRPAANLPTAAADAQALAAFRAAFADWTAVEAPANKADYQNPGLNGHLDGDVHMQVYNDAFINTCVNGVTVHGAPVLLHPSVLNSTPSSGPYQALVADCVQTSSWRGDRGRQAVPRLSGRAPAHPGAGREPRQTWRVNELIMMEPGSC